MLDFTDGRLSWYNKREDYRELRVEWSSDTMAEVEVKIYATLRRHVPGLGVGESLKLSLDDTTTLGQLVERLGLPRNEVKVIMVNFFSRPDDYVLADGDRVGIFPPVAGG
jgi:molybdopterin synthase sulfur carrier subunit